MKYVVDGIEYDVVINKKNNKNTYIRIKDNVNCGTFDKINFSL